MVGDPDLLFLDEPTTGFDPAARRQAWSLVESLKPLGKTVFLTTHYMDEAEALADRVAVIAAGVIVAEGTPQTLGGREDAPAEIRFRRPPGMDPAALLGAAARAEDGWVSFRTPEPDRARGPWRNGATRAARTCRAWRSGARPWKTSTWSWSGVSGDEHGDEVTHEFGYVRKVIDAQSGSAVLHDRLAAAVPVRLRRDIPRRALPRARAAGQDHDEHASGGRRDRHDGGDRVLRGPGDLPGPRP